MNQHFKKRLILSLLVIMTLALCACTPKATVTEIPLGEGLPVIKTGEPYVENLPADAEDQGLVKIYTSHTDQPDIYLYNVPKTAEETIKTFGEKLAKEHGVFCDIIQKEGVSAAVLNYYLCVGDEHFMVQEYIFEGKDYFVKLAYRYETEKTPLGSTGLSFRLIKGYISGDEAEVNSESTLSYEKIYTINNDDLPEVIICQFNKNGFTAESYRERLFKKTTSEQLAAYAENGWTLEKIIALYKENYDVKKAEIIHKNGLDIAFIGYVDQGIFYVRAFIDHGSDIILLGCEKEAGKFRHMTNAFLDSIEQK